MKRFIVTIKTGTIKGNWRETEVTGRTQYDARKVAESLYGAENIIAIRPA